MRIILVYKEDNQIQIFAIIWLIQQKIFSFFMFFGFLAYQCDSFVGSAEFNFFTLVIAAFTVFVEKINKGNPDEELPLIKSNCKYKKLKNTKSFLSLL